MSCAIAPRSTAVFRIMRASALTSVIVIVLLSLPAILQAEEMGWYAEGKNGAIAGGGEGGVAAGLEIMQKGGNAIDARSRGDSGRLARALCPPVTEWLRQLLVACSLAGRTWYNDASLSLSF